MFYGNGQAMWGFGAFIGALVIALCFMTTEGGGSKTASDNFNKVQSGMTVDQVTGLLGWGFREDHNPTSVQADPDPSMYELIWKSSSGEIHVVFVNDRVHQKYKR